MSLTSHLKRNLPNRCLLWLEHTYEVVCTRSIQAALREQELLPIYHQLTGIVPDITHQYCSFKVDTEYLRTKVRAEHAFQITLANEALQNVRSLLGDKLTVVDIGDSAGTHIQYIKSLYQDCNLHCLSVDVSSKAVSRIREKGLEAIQARAEDLTTLSIKADVFLSFETLEHLTDPCEFLRGLSEKANCKALVVTVPYLARSQVGLHHIRHNLRHRVNSENTHIFELSPQDWQLIFKHSGWEVQADRIYLQYPRRSILRPLLKRYWQYLDFEGFYGAILRPDKSWSRLYDSQ